MPLVSIYELIKTVFQTKSRKEMRVRLGEIIIVL